MLIVNRDRWCSFAALWFAALACAAPPEPSLPPTQTETKACVGGDWIAEVWTPTRAAELDAALEAVPGEWPDQLAATLASRMPEISASSVDAHARACASGSTAIMRCLDDQAFVLDAAIALIIEQPERASSLWARLERASAGPEGCVDATLDPPPLEPEQGRALASVAMLVELGELEEAKTRLASLDRSKLGEAYRWQIDVARVHTELAAGRAEAAERALGEAEAAAGDARARSHVAAARATLAGARGDLATAKLARERAVSEAREHGEPWLLIDRLRELGGAAIERGEPGEATSSLVEAVALSGRVGGPDNPETARLQVTLAEAQLALGQVEPAYDALIQARDAFVIALGPDHPQTLATVEAVGRLFVAAGRPGEAQFAFLDLLEIYTDLYGVKDWRTAKVKLELADSLMAMDQHESARTLYSEALTPLAQALGAVDPVVIRASIHLGIAELALGNLDAAEPHCARGRDLAKALAPDHPLADEAERCLAELAAQQKRRPKRQPKG